jgi:16S rRNA (guanine527-N7)-methyltransferase
MALAQLGAAWTPHVERVVAALSPALTPPDGFLPLACRLLDLTVSWNAKIDLTAAKSAEELVDLTLADALALFGQGALAAGGVWLDVGSGAGAPGVPLALLEPRMQMTLCEPLQKRVAFLRTLAGSLGVAARVVRGRAEALPAGSAEYAISRATLAPPDWLAEGARLATREVWVLLAREPPPSLTGWAVRTDIACTWPLTGRKRRLVAFRRSADATGSADATDRPSSRQAAKIP